MRIAYVAPFVLLACGKSALKAPVPEPPAPELIIADPTPEPVPEEVATPEEEAAAAAMLPGAWTVEFDKLTRYDDAVASMRIAHAAFDKAYASVFVGDGGLPAAAEFEKANSALELLNRRYAAVYYSKDADDAQRVATLDQAAEVLLKWADQLDAVGLNRLPKTYRTNGAVALTFEDTVHGPAKRWRGEGMTLARSCVVRARIEKVVTTASRDCAELVQTHAHLPTPPNLPSQLACACDPGDPLCSASMSGWCKTKN